MKAARATVLAIAICLLALSPAGTALASAERVGQGWIADANDKVVTAFGLGLIVFFTLFVTAMSLAQAKLAKRKKAK